MMVKLVRTKLMPLIFVKDNILICNRGNKIFHYNTDEESVTKTIKLKIPLFHRLIGKSKLLYRFFRVGIRTVERLNKKVLILSLNNKLLELDIESGKCSKGFTLPKGIRPLNFTRVDSIAGFEDSIVFGEYLSNPNKRKVNIYKRIDTDHWEVIYSFENGLINHIHNIVPDPYRDCVWIFTGDFGEGAAIWKATNNFTKVVKVFSGSQKYRVCVAFATKEGVLCATDTPFETNNIFLLRNLEEGFIINEITKISGSSIYGCQIGNNYLFSTTVESNGIDEKFIQFLVGRKRGSGILDDKVHLYFGNSTCGFSEIYSLEKDFLPFSFQFGVFKFPKYMDNSQVCYFQPISTKKYDQDLLKIELNCN